MPAELISLDEASWRLEKSRISGRAFAELILRSEPLIFGVRPGKELRDPLDMSRVTSFRAESENRVIVDGVKWDDIRVSWRDLQKMLEARGYRVFSGRLYISPELIERTRQPRPTDRISGDWRSSTPRRPAPPKRARPEWFESAVFTAAVPVSGKQPPARRGPKSGKREIAVTAMRKELQDHTITEADLRATPEKELADRYGVSRDTARKARNDVLSR